MKSSMHLRFQRIVAVLVLLTSVSLTAFAQSPKKTAEGKIGSATVSIQYSSPSVKGRTIWGDLVPYDKVWRAGADAATVITTDKDLKVEGKNLPAGSYSLFVIPGKSSWTIIFNSQTGQWGIKKGGEANLDRANDVVTVTVKPVSNAMTESLTYEVDSKGIALVWEKLKVPVKIK
ncbi:DUF2911 domain-containing protein [Olivibacter sp. CPCC 100613]|uniref:DUF2911 domain-containing protein n=1 Tax=Olivibacter sp. CPCC 100613 TaxID=3079931 RepID=UPI002FF6B67C